MKIEMPTTPSLPTRLVDDFAEGHVYGFEVALHALQLSRRCRRNGNFRSCALKLTLPPPFKVCGGAPDCAATFDRARDASRYGATN
jgi:hypothetical protein